ncbi:hypothetical protein HPB48_017399 [Haemaphysalis longicornis]|uniref:Uncharacterized protein n=1 Tax=Haemaphysalis longicornis TaxID=44386 RepID=A0A9J6GI82_HAELO|nr:hypothetical protein HPB48_017399 [Haemaphysalis longicornis]
MGALIAARMGAYLKNKVFDRKGVITFWTDSSIALGWIRGGKKWESFCHEKWRKYKESPVQLSGVIAQDLSTPGVH